MGTTQLSLNRKPVVVLAIIPARGNSKGVLRKNVRTLSGKPLIAYTIESALEASMVNRVVVSTDDPEIASVSRECGAEVINRPDEISGDMASSESALLHTLDHLERTEHYQPDLVVFLQCTSPLTLPEDIDGTVKVLLDQKADTALAVTDFHYFIWGKTESGDCNGINHDKNIRLLRQESSGQFLETGAVYVLRVKAFKEKKHRFFGKTAMYTMPKERCLEIDEPVDFQVAEVLIKKRLQERKIEILMDKISALILDFDGVFTDNKVIVMEDGREAVVCNRGDGMGLSRLRALNIPVMVLSTEKNPVVKARCDKLGVECIQGQTDKRIALRKWIKKNSLDPDHIIYLGNDINDLSCMKEVGFPVAVKDAFPEVIAVAKLTLFSSGGNGAIRELTDLIEKTIRK